MSVYIQEVLGLLKRNKKKLILDKQKDHFEFGKLFQNSSLNNAGTYGPRMEPFVVKWGDLVCQATEDLTRTQPGSGNLGYVPVYTDPEGTCSWDTLKDSIITQNAIGDTINIAGNTVIEGNLQVNQNANINLQLTAGSANILDLTNNRIVIVGTDGELEDDANFTMDGTTFTANVNVVHGAITTPPAVPVTTTVLNSNIVLGGPIYDSAGNIGQLSQVLVGLADGRAVWSNDDIVETLTLGSLWQGNASNLKQELTIGTADQILISDGTTFSWEDNPAAIVGEVCTVNSIPLWTPDSNTLGCSKLFQDGNNATPATKVTSSVTFNVVNTTSSIINVGNVAFNGTNRFNFIGLNNFSSGLSSTSNGNTIVSSFYTSTAIDAYNNYIDMYYTSGSDTNKLTIGGDSSEVVHPGLVNGSVQILPDLELEKVDDDNTLDKVLVRDATTGIIKQRDASTIFNGSGTLYRLPLWTPNGISLGDSLLIQDGDEDTPATKVTNDGILINTGVVKLDSVANDDSLVQVLVRDTGNSNEIKYRSASSIKPQVGFDTLAMTPDGWASTDGNFNAFVNLDDTTTAVKSIKDMTWLVDGDRVVVIAENVKTGSALADNAIQFPDWVNGALSTTNFSSWNAGTNSGYPTSTLLFGEKLKFRAELYQQSATINQLNWDACCKITANNYCPVASNDSLTVNEDAILNGTVPVSDDGYGLYGITYEALTQPGNGIFSFNNANGQYTFNPNANYFGVETFTFRAFDGYCYSNVATVTINVIAVNDSPIWVSDDPVTLNTYPNLTAGDQWDYNWVTSDPDTACGNLTYTVTLTDITNATTVTLPNASSWLTFTNNNNCGGTLSGTYPSTGGAFTVNMTVSDDSVPTPLSDTQTFTIAGIVPTINTYFVSWFDASGSMNGAGVLLSRASSIGYIRAVTTIPASNVSNVTIGRGDGGGGSGEGQFNNDMSDTTAAYNPWNSMFLVVDGMELFTMSPGGVETSTGAFVTGQPVATTPNLNGTIALTSPVTISTGTALVFRRTAAQKKADYNGGTAAGTRLTARSFLQDFYAIGQTEAQEDAAGISNNPSTNGSDEFDNKVKFGWRGVSSSGNYSERTIEMLANSGNGPLTTNAGDIFENADTVVVAAWGDESNAYMDTLSYTDPTIGSGIAVATDVANLQSYIAAAETAANNNSIYRALHFAVSLATPNIADLVQGLVVGIGGASPTFGGGWTNNNLKPVPNNTAPIKYLAAGYTNDPVHGVITGTGNQTSLWFASTGQTGTAANVVLNGQYYMGIWRERLVALGFVGI